MNLDAIYNIPPTLRVYNTEPYKKSGHAKVLYVEDNIAVFDRTIFYAESGGQIFDTGTINGEQVVNVQKVLGELSRVDNHDIDVPSVKVNTRIIHEFLCPVKLKVGDNVIMEIDWDRRYNVMKNHTLSHFLFYGLTEHFRQKGIDLFQKGCSIVPEKGGFSLNNKITAEDVESITSIINLVFETDSPITMAPEESNDEVFYWKYKNIVIPCGGTHLSNTNELTGFRVWRKSEGKAKSKIYIQEV